MNGGFTAIRHISCKNETQEIKIFHVRDELLKGFPYPERKIHKVRISGPEKSVNQYFSNVAKNSAHSISVDGNGLCVFAEENLLPVNLVPNNLDILPGEEMIFRFYFNCGGQNGDPHDFEVEEYYRDGQNWITQQCKVCNCAQTTPLNEYHPIKKMGFIKKEDIKPKHTGPMNYYLDTEFNEGFRRRGIFNSRQCHFIDLISIGIVTQDLKTYYAISKEFNPYESNEWVKKNVLEKMVIEYIETQHGEARNQILGLFEGVRLEHKIKYIQKQIGKTNDQIAKEIVMWIHGFDIRNSNNTLSQGEVEFHKENMQAINFYGYYSDYDWVLFSSLFGKMSDLPTGFPMYCNDLIQMLAARNLNEEWMKKHCPGPENEHNALTDALWNRELHNKIIPFAAIKRDF